MAACADPNLGYVTLVIDGLDECEGSGRTVILSWLAKHVSTLTTSASSNASFLKVLMTSWPETCIADTLRIRDLPEVRLKLEDQSENVSADVERVVRAKLDDLAEFRRLSDDERDRLERQLLGNAERTFLWVSLFLDMLQTSALATSRSWANADVNAAAGSDGLTALQLAEYYGHSKVAEVLKANADPTTSTRMA
jgi:hypothetical protein